MSIDLIAALVGFLLSLMILSYIIGDGPLFRIATYIFIGVSAGYLTVIVWNQVISAGLFAPLMDNSASASARGLLFVPLLLGMLMLMKVSPRLSWLGAPAAAYLVGVSAAVVVGGAVMGTLLPQVFAAADPFGIDKPIDSLVTGSVSLIATVTTLVYFQFGASRQADGTIKRNRIVESIAWLGGIFVAITLGALFAGVFSAALTALVERIDSILAFLLSFMGSS